MILTALYFMWTKFKRSGLKSKLASRPFSELAGIVATLALVYYYGTSASINNR